jgi:hypothetical protein
LHPLPALDGAIKLGLGERIERHFGVAQGGFELFPLVLRYHPILQDDWYQLPHELTLTLSDSPLRLALGECEIATHGYEPSPIRSCQLAVMEGIVQGRLEASYRGLLLYSVYRVFAEVKESAQASEIRLLIFSQPAVRQKCLEGLPP